MCQILQSAFEKKSRVMNCKEKLQTKNTSRVTRNYLQQKELRCRKLTGLHNTNGMIWQTRTGHLVLGLSVYHARRIRGWKGSFAPISLQDVSRKTRLRTSGGFVAPDTRIENPWGFWVVDRDRLSGHPGRKRTFELCGSVCVCFFGLGMCNSLLTSITVRRLKTTRLRNYYRSVWNTVQSMQSPNEKAVLKRYSSILNIHPHQLSDWKPRTDGFRKILIASRQLVHLASSFVVRSEELQLANESNSIEGKSTINHT